MMRQPLRQARLEGAGRGLAGGGSWPH
jgi:hypothetical protein